RLPVDAQPFIPVRGARRLVAGCLEGHADEVSQILVVVDHEDAGHRELLLFEVDIVMPVPQASAPACSVPSWQMRASLATGVPSPTVIGVRSRDLEPAMTGAAFDHRGVPRRRRGPLEAECPVRETAITAAMPSASCRRAARRARYCRIGMDSLLASRLP